MKSVNDIEKLSIEDLEQISLDETIEVPADLESKILSRSLIRNSRLPIRIISIAASLAIVAGIGFAWLNRSKPLQDTYDDPLLAYAAVEEALNKMASTVEVGVNSVAMGEELLRKPGEVIQSINNK